MAHTSSKNDFKLCSGCNTTYPRTDEYFFKRVINQINADGKMATYYCFRSHCKTCWGKKGEKRRLTKRYAELKCDESTYKKAWTKELADSKLTFKELKDFPRSVQRNITRKMKEGYVFTTIEQYKIDCSKNKSMSRRKYDYGNCVNIPKNTQTGIEHLTDGYIALTLNKKVSEVPKEVIETKRLLIKIQRQIKQKKELGDTENLKFCACCNKYYPKTLEYFDKKSVRKDYKWKIYEPFRPECKTCSYKKVAENRIAKRCREEGIERKDWENWKRKQLLSRPIFQLKDERLKGIRRPVRAVILKKIREENYVFTSYEQYKKDCSEDNSRRNRKYVYDAKVLTPKIIQETLPDYYIACCLKKKVSECTPEEIEARRALMLKKREIKRVQLKNTKQWKKKEI